MQSRYFVMGAAVLLAQLISFSTQAADQQGASLTIGESTRSTDTSTAPLTLEQAITQALSTSPHLRSAAQSVAIAEGARVQAGMRPNPELSLLREGMSSTTGRTDTYQLSQLLELGDKRGARIKFAEQDQAFARGDTNVAAAELRANVIAAYFEALTAREHVALAKESLTLASKATNAAGRRVAAGKISPLEQTRSSVAEAGARLELSQALADAALAKRRLAAFWGVLSRRRDRWWHLKSTSLPFRLYRSCKHVWRLRHKCNVRAYRSHVRRPGSIWPKPTACQT